MRLLFWLTFVVLTASCAQLTNQENLSEWDFDHQVRFQQNQLTENSYAITVLRHNDTHFAQLATFLLRHAYNLCQGYDYSLKIIDGVETFDDKKARPNWIPPSLSAKVECAVE
ncbi:hypothetical protein [Thalassotalea profundi]|uniref:Lipoprotein n=1 Tax=Thalassotalea profundi TaxID=2036687 RepID=A0ABQ3IWQ8_9GAMM|nr:hypothetical protein [Thalassotalea profundi]GHE91671.1 hypothetical protein GCM10011501_21340 [Thalassotalea profundi]